MENKIINKYCSFCEKETKHEIQEDTILKKTLRKPDCEYTQGELISFMNGDFYDDFVEVPRQLDTCCECDHISEGVISNEEEIIQYKGMNFNTEIINNNLNRIHCVLIKYLNENGMALDFFQYPADDISRIIFRDKLDSYSLLIVDYLINNCDLTGIEEVDPFVARILEWPCNFYEDFVIVMEQNSSNDEYAILNEIMQAENEYNKKRL